MSSFFLHHPKYQIWRVNYQKPIDNNESDWCHFLGENINIWHAYRIVIFLTDNLSRVCQQHLDILLLVHNKRFLSYYLEVQMHISLLSVFTRWVNYSALADLIKITQMIEWEKKKKKKCYCKNRRRLLFISAAVLSFSCWFYRLFPFAEYPK